VRQKEWQRVQEKERQERHARQKVQSTPGSMLGTLPKYGALMLGPLLLAGLIDRPLIVALCVPIAAAAATVLFRYARDVLSMPPNERPTLLRGATNAIPRYWRALEEEQKRVDLGYLSAYVPVESLQYLFARYGAMLLFAAGLAQLLHLRYGSSFIAAGVLVLGTALILRDLRPRLRKIGRTQRSLRPTWRHPERLQDCTPEAQRRRLQESATSAR
jgi:hypothetical protein